MFYGLVLIMSILNNAIDSINLGLEDYESSDHRRLISCARNIFSGILLLFKHKLSLLSPVDSDEVLIKKDVLPTKASNGEIIWRGSGTKTVDVHQIQRRFKSLGVNTHWVRIEKIKKFRNDIEHYHSKLSKDAIKALLSDSFIVINDFITDELASDPRELLDESSWNILISVNDVYQKEKERCYDELDKIDWASESLSEAVKGISCEICGSSLITIDKVVKDRVYSVFVCKSCQSNFKYDEIVEGAIHNYFSWEIYDSYHDGGTMPVISCPECSRETYIYSEKQCLLCDVVFDQICVRCGMEIIPEELDDSGYCGWCLHMKSKDD